MWDSWFKGVRKEKIVSAQNLILSTLLLPISGGINMDAVYKHLSGYYKKLKKRPWIPNLKSFSNNSFLWPVFFCGKLCFRREEVYDFVLGCAENTTLIDLFKKTDTKKLLLHLTILFKKYQ